MTEAKPPEFYFDGIEFNSQYFKDESDIIGFTQDESDARYLRKTSPDTASALQTFSAGLNFSGEINGPSIIASTNMKCNNFQSTSINQPLTLGNNQTGSGATLAIGCNVARTGNINIANTQTTGTANIVIGSTAITGVGSQNIQINRPLTIGYDAVSNLNNTFDKIGSYKSVSSSEALITNSVTAATSLVNFTNVPPGIYLFNYQIDYKITVAQTVFTQQKFILSTTENNFVAGNIIGGQFSSLFKTNQESVPVSVPTTDYTQTNSKCGTIVLNGTTDIYLNYRIVHTVSTTVPYIIGSLRLVRIG